MKKIIIISCSFFIIFSSCKITHKKETITSSEKVLEVSKENESNSEPKNEPNSESNSEPSEITYYIDYTYGWRKPIVHEMIITFSQLDIENPYFDKNYLNVWKDTSAINYYYRPEEYENQIAYHIQPDDEIKIFEFLTNINHNETVLHVECPDGTTGYMFHYGNIFEKEKYFFQESIEIDGINKDVYSVTGSFSINYKEIYALPSENSEIVYELTSDDSYISEPAHAIAITDDGEWVKVSIDNNDVVGWVPYNNISAGRGGPTIWTPYIRMIWKIFDLAI